MRILLINVPPPAIASRIPGDHLPPHVADHDPGVAGLVARQLAGGAQQLRQSGSWLSHLDP